MAQSDKLSINIAYLYPKSMNIYGDRGNIIALTQRSQWHGIKVNVSEIEIGDPFDPRAHDLVFAGGGQDAHQLRIAGDLKSKKAAIHEAVNNNVVFLLICGTYQLFGHYFKTSEGREIPGISVLDITTVASSQRKIGNVAIEWFSGRAGEIQNLVGFENHSGNTDITKTSNIKDLHLVKTSRGRQITNNKQEQTIPFCKVIHGFGNNGQDKTEGARYKNCFGTYLHGPLLPKNPHFADYLLSLALEHKYHKQASLKPLDDSLEIKAHQFVLDHRMK